MGDAEEERLRQLLRQRAERSADLGVPAEGRYMPAAAEALALGAAKAAGVCAAFDGGYEGAERVQPCFYPAGETPAFTGQWLEIRWDPRFSRIRHRDLLGSLLGLGLERDRFGDLLCGEGRAVLIALPEAAVRLPAEWTEAGRTRLTVTLAEGRPELPAQQGETLRITVPSLRLDAVLSAGLKRSRAQAAELIRRGLIEVNHRPEERIDRLLREGDLLSVRGFGRIRLKSDEGATRRERESLILEIFHSGGDGPHSRRN